MCVCALAHLSNSGLGRRYTLTNCGLESQQGTFFRSPLGHALNQPKNMLKPLWLNFTTFAKRGPESVWVFKTICGSASTVWSWNYNDPFTHVVFLTLLYCVTAIQSQRVFQTVEGLLNRVLREQSSLVTHDKLLFIFLNKTLRFNFTGSFRFLTRNWI